MNKKPLLIIAFNRPNKFHKLMNIALRSNYVSKIYIKIDGPRNFEDKKKIELILKIIEKKKNKNIFLNYEKNNIGLRSNIILGINWIFKKEKDAIILEDDNIPSKDFFKFCSKMLDMYRDSKEVMHISGTNFSNKANKNDFFFSKMPDIVGWATWKKSWKKLVNEFNLKKIISKKVILNYYEKNYEITHWFYEYLYREVNSTKRENLWSTWWQLTIILHNGVCINPGNNLVYHDGYLVIDDPVHLNEKAIIKNLKIEKINVEKLKKKKIIYYNQMDRDHFLLIKKTDPHFNVINRLRWFYKFFFRNLRSDFYEAKLNIN